MEEIELKFNGYYRDVNRHIVSNKSGVYLVYRCVYNKDKKPKPTVTLKELIYIGESETIRDRIGEEHESRKCWEGKLKTGEVLCFSFAPAIEKDRKRAEAALVYKKKPVCNDQGKDSFNYDKTIIKSTGRCMYIPEEVTVEKSK